MIVNTDEMGTADEHGPIEGSVKVYLIFDAEAKAWRIDTVSGDGYSLDSALPDDAPSDCDSFYGWDHSLGKDAHRELHHVADETPLPTLEELYRMIGELI